MKKISAVVVLAALVTNSFAIESSTDVVGVYDIVTEDNKWKSDIGLSYTTQSQDLIEGAGCALVTSVVSKAFINPVPVCRFDATEGVSVFSRNVNVDQFTLSGSLRRRFNKKLQLFTFFSGNYVFSRDTITSSNSSSRAFGDTEKATFNNFGIGASYNLKAETTSPAIILSASMPIYSRQQSILGDYFTTYAQNIKVSANTIFTVDPLVFSLELGYRFERKVEGEDNYNVKAGSTFSVDPTFYFAVNPYTTLNFGYQFSYTGNSRLGFDDGGEKAGVNFDYQKVNKGLTRGSFRFGAQYEIARKYVMSVDVQTSNSSNSSASSISFGLTIDF